MIITENLSKTFVVDEKQKGIAGAVKALIKPERKRVNAVDNISFSIDKGELIGFLGPNGAGKSTTVKMMSGILRPTSGEILIDGESPFRHRKKVMKKLGVVFGQRTQLFFELRLGESFELLKRMYGISDKAYSKMLYELNQILQFNEFIDRPVRQLSLGQRMRGDLVAAMLHEPEILFLDEPTIGLDFEAKEAIRKFCKQINEDKKVTIILTTHDMRDVEALAKRLLVINHGSLVADDNLNNLMNRITPQRELIIRLATSNVNIPCMIGNYEVKKIGANELSIRYNHKETNITQLISFIADHFAVNDISIREPHIEDVLKELY